MDGDGEQRNKSHKGKTTGNKAAKKEAFRKKKAGIDLEPNRGSNIKAFGGPSAGSRKVKQFNRSVEKRETALHVPTADKTLRDIVAEPPLLVAVVGPPGVGKSTLIRSLVKFYSDRNIRQVRGPITVVAGKSRRVTFFECPNQLAAMCDIAKVADLILLMVDGAFGFEMETFEFLNIAQTHGFPKMFGVVSHLDQLKTGKALKKRKKFLRHRFWHEVAAGAKVLCLSPMVRGLYRPTDVLNLHRLLICVEPKIQSWRNTHSCVLMDRFEDITDPEAVAADPNVSRDIAFYGYARGKPLKPGQLVHIPGLGDFPLAHLSLQDDPCALETHGQGNSQGHRMRHLSAKHKKLYAPYCDVGGLTYDEDAVYVHRDAELDAIQRTGAGVQMLRELQTAQPLDAARETHLSLVGGGGGGGEEKRVRRAVVFRDEDTMELDVGRPQRPDDSDDDSDDAEKEDDALYSDDDGDADPTAAPSLAEFGLPDSGSDGGDSQEDGEEDEGEGEGGEEEAGGSADMRPRLVNDPDAVRILEVRRDWTDAALLRSLKDLCVTGNWAAGEEGEENDGEEEGEEGDDNDNHRNTDKGYDSDDEDFEAQARGEKPFDAAGGANASKKRGKGSGGAGPSSSSSSSSGSDNTHSDKDEDDISENDDVALFGINNKKGPADALAGVGYAGGKKPAASAFGDVDEDFWKVPGLGSSNAGKNSRGKRGGKKNGGGGGGSDSDGDSYDMLADESSGDDDDSEGAAGGEGKDRYHNNGSNTGDNELDHLVNSFLVRDAGGHRRGGGVGSPDDNVDAFAASALGASNGHADDDDDAIQFYDAAAAAARKGRLANVERARQRDEAEEAAESAAVMHGVPLSAEQERRMQKKMDKKRAFDEAYDLGEVAALDGSKNATYSHYHQLTRAVEEKKSKLQAALGEMGDDVDKKVQLVGYFSGLYVRFVIRAVPVEFTRLFDASLPLIAGGVNPGEDEYRIVHARLKRHRWYPKILKAQDPLLLSMGWRRFQTQPIFATEDPNGRCRYLKYTPEHMHCIAAFYAPVAPTNTGFIAIPVQDIKTPGFRIPCTGYTVGNDVATSIVKKLKLTGTPSKIDKTNVFIKGMFTSDMEAAKFVGVKLKSVSGIRGIIKAAPKGKQGLVRATFEDKLFPSDIVFIRSWKHVDPPQYCSLQRNLLDREWRGMRPMRELRWESRRPLADSMNPDSEYKEIKRRHRVVDEAEDVAATGQKVLLSRSTRLQLPFEMKEEFIPLARASQLRQRTEAALTVAPEARDQRRRALLDTFRDKADAMHVKKDAAKKRARERSAAAAAREEEKYLQGLKKAKKETARRNEFRSQHKTRK